MAEPMTPERRAEIRERVEMATPGPWRAWDRGVGYNIATGDKLQSTGHPASFLPEGMRTDIGKREDAEFIAHSRQDVNDLLADVDRLTAALVDLDREASLAGQALAEKTINCEALSEYLSEIADLLGVPETPEQAAGERWGTATRKLAEMVADGKAVR